MSLTRKRKKELRRLQDQASKLWESQQTLASEAAGVAREAGRQLGNFGREQVGPAVTGTYNRYAAPYVGRGVQASRRIVNEAVIPATGALVGGAMSVWDAANDTRARLAAGRGLPDAATYRQRAGKYGRQATKALSDRFAVPEPRTGPSAGAVIAIVLGALAAAGVLYAAWQTLRADDELWVADDPLRAPDE